MVTILLLTGCKSSQHIAISSIEDISTDKEGGFRFLNFDQQRSIHTGGLLPYYAVGQMYVPPAPLSPFSPSKYVALSDQINFLAKDLKRNWWYEIKEPEYNKRLDAGEGGDTIIRGTKSQKMTVTYKCKASDEDVKKIIATLSEIKRKNVEYLNARLDVAILRDNIAKKEKIEEKITKSSNSNEKLIQKKQYLDDLIGNQTVGELEKIARDIKQEIATLEDTFLKKAHQKNLMIARWNGQSSKNVLAHLSSTISTALSGKESKSGYVILKGIRVSTLLLGTDISYLSYPTTLNWNRPVITTLWQTESAIAVADLEIEEQFKVKLDASYKKLKDLNRHLRKMDRIEIETTFRNLQKLANSSWVSDPTIKVENIEWDEILKKVGEKKECKNEECKNGECKNGECKNWSTFYAVHSNHSDLKGRVRVGKWRPLKEVIDFISPF